MQANLNKQTNLSPSNPFFGKWDSIVSTVAKAFNLKEEESERLKKTKLAQLLAALPFLAGCEDPERTAVTHIGTYLLTIRTSHIFDHQPSDDKDLMRRIRMIDNHVGGDRKIIQRGFNIILLNMLGDYVRDQESDKKAGKYNPVAAGKMDHEKEHKRLQAEINAVSSPYMEEIVKAEEAPELFWAD